MSVSYLNPEDIQTKGMQVRAKLSEETVKEYCEAMAGGAKFPPVTVYRDDSGYWLADGFHRLEAWKRTGVQKIKAEVREGGRIEALKFAFTANCTHGLRPTNEDKRKAVMLVYENRIALGLGEVPSANSVATLCGVSHTYAGHQLATVATWANATSRQGVDGKTYNLPPIPVRPRKDSGEGSGAPVPTRGGGIPIPVQRSKNPSEHCGTDNGEDGGASGCPSYKMPAHLTDVIGQEIPKNLAELWMRRTEIQDVVKNVQRARLTMMKAQEGHDPLWGSFMFNSVQMHLDNALAHIKGAVPHCVCVYCHGIGCKVCQTGLMPLAQYERLPREYKK
jgi:uncharacterized ParB-like nuclease family protein